MISTLHSVQRMVYHGNAMVMHDCISCLVGPSNTGDDLLSERDHQPQAGIAKDTQKSGRGRRLRTSVMQRFVRIIVILRWLGHVFRMPNERLHCTMPGTAMQAFTFHLVIRRSSML